MKYSALIGNPTDHSVSHILYAELVKNVNLDDFYQHIRVNVEPTSLRESLEAFKTLHFAGLSVTLPHKLAIMPLLDKLDPVAQELGAVNTIKLGDNTTGFNTDWVGITESIKTFGPSISYTTATIFGTGGAARAAIYACKQLEIGEINVVYRQEPSEATRQLLDQSRQLGICMNEYAHVRQLVKSSQLIINATSAGMIHKDKVPFDLGLLEGLPLHDKVYFDAVFKPLETPLLRYFQESGAQTIDGLWMMVFQGIDALSIWLDCEIKINGTELHRIHNLLKEELAHV